MRKRPKLDQNQEEIIQALRTAGCSVLSLASLGSGVCDILLARNGNLALAEIKNGDLPPSARKLTPDQEKWIANWKSKVFLLTCVEDAIKLANAMANA